MISTAMVARADWRRRVAAVALVAIAAACSGDDEDAAPPPPSIAEQTLPPTTADPYAVPPVIDVAYVTRVLAGLDQATGDIVRMLVRTRQLTPEALEQLDLVFADRALRDTTNGFVQDVVDEFSGYKETPGNTVTTVRELISSRADCIFAAVKRDYSAVAREPAATIANQYVAIKRGDRSQLNPTGWILFYEAYTPRDVRPENPC
jgi:hypothetical protein